MFKAIIVFLLFLAGWFGYLFFNNYHGHFIPHPIIWLGLSITSLIAASFLSRVWAPVQARADKNLSPELRDIRENGEKVICEDRNCVYKSNEYEITEPVREFTGQFGVWEDIDQRTRTDSISQSLLIYTVRHGSRSEEFRSQILSLDITSLQARVMKGEVVLYIDRFDRGKYYFDLK